MRVRLLLLSLGAATVAAGGATASALVSRGGDRASCSSSAGLRLADTYPLTLRGRGFCARERVRVVARVGGSERSHRLRASPAGRFRVAFPRLPYESCGDALNVSARGSDGVLARLKRPHRECPVAPGP